MVGLRESNDQQALRLLKDVILSLCCNLGILDGSLDVFRVAHASVEESLKVHLEFDSQEINLQAAAEAFTLVQSEWTLQHK